MFVNRIELFNLARQSTQLFAARIVGGLAAFLSTVVIARHFGAGALGAIALCLAITSILAVLICGGRQAVAPLFIARYLEQKQPGKIRGFVHDSLIMMAGASMVSMGLLGGAYWFLAGSISALTTMTIATAAISAPALSLIIFNGAVLTGYRRPLLGLAPDLFVKPALLFAAIIAAILCFAEPWPGAVFGAVGASFWLTALSQAAMIYRLRCYPATPPDAAERTTWHKTALPWITIVLLADYLIELHLLLAGSLLAPAALGVLHVCFRLRMLASFGMRALYSVFMPDVYAAHARGDLELMHRRITQGNALVCVYAGAACTAFAVLGAPLLGLFGDGFAAGYALLLVISLSMLPRAMFGPSMAIMAAAERSQKPMIAILIAAAALSGGIIYTTSNELGALSFALGYTTAITAAAIAQWAWTWHQTGIDSSIFAAVTARVLKPASPDSRHGTSATIG